MTTTESGQDGPRTPPPAVGEVGRLARGVRGMSRVVRRAGTTATDVLVRVPSTMDAARAGARGTTTALQALSDSTLRSLAASSVALSAGFYLAGAPRLAIAAGVAPAVIMGAAIVLRPIHAAGAAEAVR